MATGLRFGTPISVSSDGRGAGFTAWAELVRGALVVHISGELGLAGRHLATDYCLQGGQLLVRVDMTELTFMDADGYGGLVAARNLIERCSGSMTFLNATGQPRGFLANIATLSVSLDAASSSAVAEGTVGSRNHVADLPGCVE